MEQVTEYAVATKMRAELRSDFKMLSETAIALEKKELEIFKDEPGQPQIPVLGPGKVK